MGAPFAGTPASVISGCSARMFSNAAHRCSTALEDVDDPSQRDDRPGKLHHVGVEGHEAADADAMQQHLASADPEHDHNRQSQQGFQSWPEHAHQADQLQTAPNVFGVVALEAFDLRLLLNVGANQAGAGKVFLRFGRDVGEHGLDALEAFVDLAPEILHHDADDGQRRESEDGQPRADAQHEGQRARGEDHGVGGVHDARADQHAHRVEVVGGAGHDVAGAGALVEAVGEPLEMGEQVVAQVEFDLARDANQDPAREELEDGFGAGDGEQPSGIGQQLMHSDALVQVVDGAADDQREENPDAVVAQHAERADPEGCLVLAQIGK